MKIISLNCWGGKFLDTLTYCVKNESRDTDIFCFQEMLSSSNNLENRDGFCNNLLERLSDLLWDFNLFFFPYIKDYDMSSKRYKDLYQGEVVFVNKKLKVLGKSEQIVVGKRFVKKLKSDFSNTPANLSTVELQLMGSKYFINTFHGISRPGTKLDTSKRVKQSKTILRIMDTQKDFKILMGDFNLMPWTESIKILEKSYRNLIKDFKIKNTRGRLNIINGKIGDQRFADYTFVSSGIKVRDFKVPDVTISDHLPMILEFE